MTPTFGWSLDYSGRRRLSVILPIVLLSAAFTATGVHAGGYDPAHDPNSMASTTEYIGAQAWWAAGYTGRGIDVALIDSGVSPVDGLNTRGKVVYGPDLSLESQAPNLTNLDTYGHGTFMAGLIAGHDSTLTAPYDQAPASAYRGMAPDARIVSIKVATADGGTDVSQVIAAIDWVVQHHRDDGLNIRVINLSFGTNSTQAYTVDPLAFAVEQAWKEGIVVVAAGGNSGFQTSHGAPALADPAYDREIIAVGASDSMGTATLDDDRVPGFSASAKARSTRAPDFVAPGVHLQGLVVGNSYIDTKIAGKVVLGDRFMRGSGTSEAAAITSGAVALILDKYPNATPNQVKKLLKITAYDLPNTKATRMGSGELDLGQALSSPLPAYAGQYWPDATGTGSLERARGTDHLTRGGVVLEGEQDIFGMPFDADAMANLEADGNSWSGRTWNGSVWIGEWSGNSWSGNSWSSSSWSGNSWSGNSWSGNSWSGSSWSGKSWSGNSWSGNSWSMSSWD